MGTPLLDGLQLLLIAVPIVTPVSETAPDDAAPTLTLLDIAARVAELACGERLVLTGIGRDGIADILRTESAGTRSILLMAAGSSRTTDAVIDQLLDDLAALALQSWPRWYGLNEHDETKPLHRELADPLVSGPWLKAAAKCVEAGRAPRFRRAARALELSQLLRAINPSGVILVAELDPAAPSRAAAMIQALEGCRGRGAAIVAVFPTPPPAVPPYDRVLYGVYAVAERAEPVADRFIAPRSQAHHASATEKRIEEALRRDAELGPLFACNRPVAIGSLGAYARVDLLFAEHGVVVELDGPEHRGEPKFGNDRHRDYELLLAGYHVLRITNAQVEADLPRAIEKIRDVVRLGHKAEKGSH